MKYAYPPKPHRMSKKPTIFQSLIPILTLIGLIGLNVTLLGDDTLSGANQMSLLIASGVAACIAFYNRKHWDDILKGILHTLTGAIPAILILLMIGVLAGTWMLSGIIPAMIHYGLYILRPDYFLPAAVVISAVISVATGSSWSTVATVGVALLGIGQTLGFNDAMIAGAIISGAYFGDKISPLSDTTNLAAATAEVSLFTHIRYMMFTTGPTMLITLVIFVILSLCSDIAPTGASVESVQQTITTLQHFAAAVHRAGHRNRNDRPENATRTGALHRRNPGRDPRADLPTVGHRPTERRRGTHGRRSLPGHHQSNVRYHLDEHGRSGSRCPVHFERDGRDAEHRLVDRHRDDFRRSNGKQAIFSNA
ncbi:MAG: Na+/H+ antiporter NhaC family protein [Alistipes indistinctus]